MHKLKNPNTNPIRLKTNGYLEKLPFHPIAALDSNFNPQNTKRILAVKSFVCLALEQKF